MSALNVLYYALATGFIILVLFLAYVAFQIAAFFRSIRTFIDEIEDITRDISFIKNSVKLGVLDIILKILSTVRKRGETK